MIRASFTIYNVSGLALMNDAVSGSTINSALLQVRRNIKQFRKKALLAKELDPLRNWADMELFLSKNAKHIPPEQLLEKEVPTDAE